MEKYWKEEDFSNAKERSVFDILREHKGERVASYWHCCLKVLRNFEHPEKILLAAHCLREVMNGLGIAPLDNLSNYINHLSAKWQKVAKEWTEIDSGKFGENAKGEILKFLRLCKEMFEKLSERRETKVQMADIVKELDPSKIGTPLELRIGIGDELKAIRRKATDILHGKEIEGHSSFMETLERFEEIIISSYKPRTFEKQAEIDELIREAEAND
ncbi:MAG: hypothetical protein FVQ84_03445 [Planctomycetes bacterium]|nr:hypothetical protein [Planctomycetota bacterium]